MKPFWIAGVFLGLVFLILFSVRLELFNSAGKNEAQSQSLIEKTGEISDRDTWMNIFQNGRKIGYSNTVLSKKGENFYLKETAVMRINTLGVVQDMKLKTEGLLNPDFTLSSIQFEVAAGPFQFSAQGKVSEGVLSVKTKNSASERTIDIKIGNKPYLASLIPDAVSRADVKPGDTLSFDVFDPSTMAQERITVSVLAKEEIPIMGKLSAAVKISLNFKGASQLAWIGKDGEMLKEEGLLGMTLEKTTREDALFGLALESSDDLTQVASVASNIKIEAPQKPEMLKLEISGIDYAHLRISGGRQSLEGNILTIRKESLANLPDTKSFDTSEVSEFLKSTPFIQSDHGKIHAIAKEIALPEDSPLEKVRKTMAWIAEHIEKRPVLSIPDAISTLESRMGDCNEHAMLFAALLRASGIPAKVEAGLVYLRGRFYYHAWNLIYIGKWITADSLFGQLPADVTHIRFAAGEQKEQLDLLGVIGKVELKILEVK